MFMRVIKTIKHSVIQDGALNHVLINNIKVSSFTEQVNPFHIALVEITERDMSKQPEIKNYSSGRLKSKTIPTKVTGYAMVINSNRNVDRSNRMVQNVYAPYILCKASTVDELRKVYQEKFVNQPVK